MPASLPKLRFFLGLAGATAALLSSCAVYVPTVPSTPLLTKAGATEVTASIRGLSSLEASAAYSPAANVLLTAEGALQSSSGSRTTGGTTFNYHSVHKQAGVGLGTYRLVGATKTVYLGAIGGFGFAQASVYDPHDDDFLFGGNLPVTFYQASYQRYYGQLYAAHLGEVVSYGASARGTFVHYSQLRRNDQAIASPTHFFVEPTLFLRVGRGPIQGQGTLGVSIPTNFDAGSRDQRNLSPVTMLISAGVVFRPQLLGHRKQD